MLTIPFVLLVLATFISLAAVLCNAALPSLLRSLKSVNPEFRAHLLLLIVAAPWLIGASVLASSIADILFGACEFGANCLWNEDPAGVDSARALIVVPLLLAIGLMAIRVTRRHVAARHILKTLEKTGIDSADPAVRILPSEVALAFASKGRIYLSSRLDESLAPEQHRAVVLHEQAHLQRRDGLLHTVAGLLSAAYLPHFRKRILNALALANEQSCDQRAADVVGATTVASAILAVEKLSGGMIAPLQPGFADSFVAARVQRLLSQERPVWNFGLIRTVIVLGIVSAFLIADILYYMTMLILYPSVTG